jgi:outer membrane protein
VAAVGIAAAAGAAAVAGAARFFLLAAFTGSAHASGIQVDVIPNFIGAGLGVTTEWLGAKDKVWGIVPGGRAALEKNRFVEVYGPMADMNLLDSPNWEFGPFVSYRFGRSDVKDPVVNLLPPIEGGLEAGVFAGWHLVNLEGIPYRIRLGVSMTTAVSGGATGGHVTPYASLWVPLSPTLFVGLGGGFTWSSESFMQQRFGVSPEASAASGLPAYSAGAGVRQYYVWPALLMKLTGEWYAGAGAFWQRITGDGAGSPVVQERDQITAGVGLGYSW